MAAFLVRAFDLPQAGDAGFSDTAANTHHDAINALAASGITLGYGDGTFRPHQSTARAQMAAFINRALTSPQDQQPPDSQFSAVTAGGLHSCGLRTDNTIACWGADRCSQRTVQRCDRRRAPLVRAAHRQHHPMLGRRLQRED